MTTQQGSSGNDVLTGTDGDDTLFGLTGSDSIFGGGGNDQIEIRDDGSSDTLDGGAGGWDSLWFRGAITSPLVLGANIIGFESIVVDPEGAAITQLVVVTDAAFSSPENGRLDLSVWSYESNQVEVDASAVTVGGLTIYGTNGADTLLGGARDDVLAGNMGNDWLESGAGYDVLWGHRGDDTLDGGADRDSVVYQLGSLTSSEFQNLYLEATGPQAWVFGSGTDVWFTIQRVNGSDDLVVTDNRSASSVRDGSEPHGVDVLRAIEELAFEAQYAGAGWDRITPQIYGVRAANIAISNEEGMLNLTLEDNNVVLGTNAADTLFGEGGSDHVAALDGDDRISAGAGNDRIIVLHDIGGDVIDGGLGEDVLQVVTYGSPMVVGANISSIERMEIDPVESSSGQQLTILDDAVRSRIGDDGRLYSVGFWGQNTAGVMVNAGTVASAGLTITTSNGNDTIDGTLGDDHFWVFAGNDQVSGNGGNDHIDGEFGNDILNGGSGNDTLLGGPGNDTLLGDAGDDRFHGGPGSDVLDGGEQKRVPWLVSTSGDYDRLDYGSTAGITVDLLARTVVVTGEEGTDNYAGIEEIVGAYNGADTITGRLTNSVADAEFGTAMYLYLQGGSDTVVQDGYGYQQNWADGVLVGYHWSQTGIELDYVGDTATVTYGASGNQMAGQDTLSRVVVIGDTAHDDHFDLSQATVNQRGYVTDSARGASWHTLLLGRGGDDIVVGNGLTSVHYGSVNATSDGNGLMLDLKAGSADLSNLSTNGVALGTLTFSGVRGITGTRFNDTLIGGLAANNAFESFRGDGGDDLIDGGSGFDRASYRWSADGVNVQLAAGIVSSTSSGTDTLRSIESVQGSMFADVYDARGFWGGGTSTTGNVGSFTSGFNEFQPEGGDDVIYGNGKTRLDYDSVMVAVRVDLREGVADARLEADKATDAYRTMGRDTFSGVYDVRGSQYDDELIGGNPANGSGAYDGDERFRGNAGNDTIDGGSGFDIAYYDNSPTAVQVTLGGLVDGVAYDGWGFVDVLREIQEVVGSHFADQLNGSSDNVFESLEGRGGDDNLNGGLGTTRASYISSPTGAVVDLAAGTAQDGWGGTDTLIGIEWVRGSEHADSISGSDAEWGEAFEPRGGNDTVDGRGGIDQVRYNHAPSAVQVDLAAGTANDGTGGTDTLISIENVYATNYNDSVVGSSGANVLEGLSGNDTLFGGGGDDTLYGGDGDDLLAGNGGLDFIDGGKGNDIVSYFTAAGAVSVSLVSQFTTNDGHGGTDSLNSIELIWGSAYSDMLVGGLAANGTGATGGFEGFQGFAGDDTIDGGQGFDRAYYTESPTAVTVQLGGYNAGSAQDGYGGVDTLISIEEVRGSAFNDLLLGSDDPLFESYEGRQGDDTINGGAGTDRISFQTSPNGVVVDLAAGTAGDGWGGTDTFSGIENIRGSDHGDKLVGDGAANHFDDRAGDDTISGGDGWDTILGSVGNDWIDGGTGLDFVIYKSSPSAIVIDMRLEQGQAQDGWGGVDTLVNVDIIHGSEFADVVIGPSAPQGYWIVEGRGGADTIEGGDGVAFNEVAYADSPSAVTVRLSAWVGGEGGLPFGFSGSAWDGFGTLDVFRNIRNIEGSAYDDLLIGDEQDNILDGRAGNDTIDGGEGQDMVEFNQATSGIHVDLSLGAVFDDGQGGSAPTAPADGAPQGPTVRDTLISIEDIDGGAWNDLIIGSDVANLLKGQGGDDTLEGSAGDDTLDGGDGTDLVHFSGQFADYAFTWSEDGSLTVSDQVAGRDGVDLLRSVERLQFADRTIEDLDQLHGAGVSGRVYHWKSHALLDNVHISMGRTQDVAEDPQQPLDLRNLRFDGVTGRLTVDVWAQPAEAASTFQFTVSAGAAQSMTFSSALGSGWAAYSGIDGGALTWAAFPQSLSVSLQAPTRLGELTIQFSAGTSAAYAAFSGVVVGDASVSMGPELVVGPSTASDSAGHFLVGGSTSGSAVLHASRLADAGTPRSGINVQDAYAALKMAFGINPNADPDGNGPALPLQTSPYQFMAADVNGSGTVTLSDALAILRMAVGAPNAISPEWMFVEENRDFWDEAAGRFTLDKDNAAWDRAVQIQLPDQSQTNLVGVLKGDVNGSWQPSGSILKVTDFQPDHFISLSQESGVPLDQWGVYPS